MKKISIFLIIIMIVQSMIITSGFDIREDYTLFETIVKEKSNPADNELNWKYNQNWSITRDSGNMLGFTSGSNMGDLLWFGSDQMKGAWQIAFTFEILLSPSNEAVIKIPIGSFGKASKTNLVFTYHPAGLTSVSIEMNNGIRIMHSGWITGGDKKFNVVITHPTSDSQYLHLDIFGNNTFIYREDTPTITSLSNGIQGFGIYGADFELAVSNILVDTDYRKPGEYSATAKTAIDDMINNFWTKGVSTGNILPTWCGYPTENLPDSRGMLWERAMMVIPMFSMYRATGDNILKERLISEWAYIKSAFSEEELAAAGSGLHPAVDDSGWAGMMYTMLYSVTKDEAALNAAKKMVDNAFIRWYDDEYEGGLWYKDGKQFKSLYQCGIMTTAMNIWELTGDEAYKDKFFLIYNWVEKKLRREDGLYWINYLPNGPDGMNRPDDIREGTSVTGLMTNMAMGAINGRLYQKTGESIYKERALGTAEGIYKKEKSVNNIYINDRDAWANGTFAPEWALYVLTLPGIDEKHITILLDTAKSIAANTATGDGYYGGSWDGPAEGLKSVWFTQGSRPQQIMTSGSTVNILTAAATIERIRGK